MNKKIIIGIVALTLIFMFSGCASIDEETPAQTEDIEEEDVLVFKVVTSPWKPYMYEEDGEYKGIYVEMMNLTFNNLGIEYEFELFPWPRAYKMGEEGVADGFLGASYKMEREPVIRFTDTQRTMGEILNSGGDAPKAYLSLTTEVFYIRKKFL